ncbi:MAG: pyridoxal phosphate-dependent aminotransferase [Gemmatimonadota bacterium]
MSDFVRSPNIELLRESATIAVSQRAKALREKGRRIIDLGAGEPDFPTPAFIRDAAAAAMDAGHTRYTATEGIVELRQAIAAEASRRMNGSGEVTHAGVVVSNGSKQSIFNACFVLFGEGDDVLIPTPSWTSYYEIVQLARATAVEVPGDVGNGLKVSADDLAGAAGPRTRGLIINSPCNPTGSVYSREELDAILDLARAKGWWVISDEIYRHITYNDNAASALGAATRGNRLIVVDGVAKAWAMTGWRVGWAIAPPEVAAAMTAFQSHATFHTSSISQHAAVAALTQEQQSASAIAAMVDTYRDRRDRALKILESEPALRYVRPDGAFYLYVDVGSEQNGADAGTSFAARLLEEGVAVVPGVAFRTPGWIRISYAADTSDVVEGVSRVVDLWRSRHRPTNSTEQQK